MSVSKALLLLFLFPVFMPAYLMAQEKMGFTIDGNIRGLEEGEKVVLKMVNTNGLDEEFFDGMVSTDSAYVKNGKFLIKGNVLSGPRAYTMNFNKHQHKFVELYIDNGEQIKIEGDSIHKIQHSYIQHYLKIDGSLTNYGMMCLQPLLTFYIQSMSRLNGCIRRTQDSIGFNGPAIESFITAKEELNETLIANFLTGGRDPEIAKAGLFLSYSLFRRSGYSALWPYVHENLSSEERASFYGKLLNEKIKLCVGQSFPEFTLPTPEGKMLALKDVVAKSKITIVHFWARKSVERKKYQTELLALYKKYHDKGLNVIGFSTDKYKDEWLEALQEPKFPWYNVAELKGLEGMARRVYHEYSSDYYNDFLIHNTTNVVLDAQGKILAWDVSGAELQYYLWKNLGE